MPCLIASPYHLGKNWVEDSQDKMESGALRVALSGMNSTVPHVRATRENDWTGGVGLGTSMRILYVDGITVLIQEAPVLYFEYLFILI